MQSMRTRSWILSLVGVLMFVGLPAMATHFAVDEHGDGTWDCSSDAHAYVKASSGVSYEWQHKKLWDSALSVEELEKANSSGVSYTYGFDSMDTNVDYWMSADNLSKLNSWPGCISD